MIKVSEGFYKDVQRSDILKNEMFYELRDTKLLSTNLGDFSLFTHTTFGYSSFKDKCGNFTAKQHDVTKHMIGRTIGEAIDWIKTKSN